MGRFTVRSPPPQMSASCTLFNLFNVLIAIALALVGAWSNMMFICIIAVNTLIGIVQELHAKKLVEKLSLLSAPTVRVIRDGKHSEIPIHELVEQDVIELEAGRKPPPFRQLHRQRKVPGLCGTCGSGKLRGGNCTRGKTAARHPF